MKRIIAIDYGDARTGVAVSDLTGTLAGEALTIQEWNAEKLAQRLAFFARERDAEKFVLGLPKNMDGTEGPRAEKARQFKELLEEASGLPVILWDERRSSIEAHAILSANGKREKKHKKTVDALAAALAPVLGLLGIPPETAALPSKLCPHRPRAVASFVAVPALPLTAVCTGCTWSSLAHFVAVPTAAVAATFGAAVPA